MKLTQTQKNTLVKKLEENGIQKNKCQICGKNHWLINDAIFELREFSGGQVNITEVSMLYPVIPLTCSNCGNTHFLNALVLGILGNVSVPVKGGIK